MQILGFGVYQSDDDFPDRPLTSIGRGDNDRLLIAAVHLGAPPEPGLLSVDVLDPDNGSVTGYSPIGAEVREQTDAEWIQALPFTLRPSKSGPHEVRLLLNGRPIVWTLLDVA
jgi:hypothetical protein